MNGIGVSSWGWWTSEDGVQYRRWRVTYKGDRVIGWLLLDESTPAEHALMIASTGFEFEVDDE